MRCGAYYFFKVNTMITVKEAAEKWGTSVRNVQDLCKRGRIEGARRIGRDWMIPADASKPSDARKSGEENKPLVRKSPFLMLTDLYNVAGGAEINTIDSYAIKTSNLGKLVISADAKVGTINLYDTGKYKATLTIEAGAEVGAINYNGVTYTAAEWMARA